MMYESVRENTKEIILEMPVVPPVLHSLIYSVPGVDMTEPCDLIKKFSRVAHALAYCAISVLPNKEGANSPPTNDV